MVQLCQLVLANGKQRTKKNSCLPEWLEGFQTRKQIHVAIGETSCWHVRDSCRWIRGVRALQKVHHTAPPTESLSDDSHLIFLSSSFLPTYFRNLLFPQKERTRAPEIGQTPKNHFTIVRSCVQKLVVCANFYMQAKSMLSATSSKCLELIRSSSLWKT